MTSWNSLTPDQKRAHNAACAEARAAFDAVEVKRQAASAWVAKNGPAAAPFGAETVETRALAALESQAQSAWEKYIGLRDQYRTIP